MWIVHKIHCLESAILSSDREFLLAHFVRYRLGSWCCHLLTKWYLNLLIYEIVPTKKWELFILLIENGVNDVQFTFFLWHTRTIKRQKKLWTKNGTKKTNWFFINRTFYYFYHYFTTKLKVNTRYNQIYCSIYSIGIDDTLSIQSTWFKCSLVL